VKGAIVLHKTLGLMMLAIVVLRIVWRLFLGRRTKTSSAEPLLLRLGAKGAHLALYALLIITPMLGWLYQDAKAIDVHVFGLELPMLLYYDRELAMWIYGWKKVAAYSLLALIFLHAVAAIGYHSVLRKDGVLRSMLPGRLRGASVS
jgi:cytochrome b561